MNTARVFRTIWRIDGVLLLVAGLLLVGAVLLVALSSLAPRRGAKHEAPPVAVASKGEHLFLGRVEELRGTQFVVLPLENRPRTEKFALSSGRAYASDETRNLLFYDAATGAGRWLRPDHDGLVLRYDLIRESGAVQERYNSVSEARSNDPVRWVRYELAVADSNHDGRIGEEDLRQLAISSPSGDDLTIVLDQVEEVLGYAPTRNGVIVVFFRRADGEFVAEIDLPQRKVRSTKPLPKT